MVKTTDRDKRKAQIKAEQARLMDQLNRIESEEARERALPLIGKCFKLRNSFGHGSKGWWLYAKILRYDSPAFFHLWQFETDEYGRFTAHFNESRSMNSFLVGSEWTPISDKQFLAEWKQQTELLNAKAVKAA